MRIKSGIIDGFEGYSQFNSLSEFNHNLEMWMAVHKRDFTKGELVGLKRLARFAAKVPGVCNAKIGTMLKAIHEQYNKHGISRATFKRMILKAKNLGIFTVHETSRRNGSQSSNLYVFNRFPKNELLKEELLSSPNKTINPSETKIIKNNKREEIALSSKIDQQASSQEQQAPAPEDYHFVSDRVPAPFVELVKCFFPKSTTIEEFWRMSTISAYKNNQERETGTILSVSLDSFKQLVRKLKSTAKVKNPLAYFTGILNKKFQEIYFAELFEMGFCMSE